MIELDTLQSYEDVDGNVIVSDGSYAGVKVTFRGRNNRIEIHPATKLTGLKVTFDCDNGTLVIGSMRTYSGSNWNIRIGQDAAVRIGNNVTTTEVCAVSAVEGTTVRIGNDVMIASRVQIRGDDGHPIFDVRTGRRVNPAKSIKIGNHVWLGWGAMLLAGANVATGSVIGANSVVTRSIPNNCIAAGSPAKVIRRDIAWERPHLSLSKPPYKPDISSIQKTERFWNLTQEPRPVDRRSRLTMRVRNRLRRKRPLRG